MATAITITMNQGSSEYELSTGARGPAGASGATGADGTNGADREVKSASFTAALGTGYTATASLTVTDPTPAEGEGYSVLVRNGTATIGGTGYATAGTIVERVYHSGAWANYQYKDAAAYATAAQGSTADSALQPTDIASGTITPYVGDLDFSGGLGGTVDNAAVNAAIAEDPAATREAAQAETTKIAWLDRFARNANGTVITTGSVSENGNSWEFSPGGAYAGEMTVVDGALEPASGSLIYMGGTVASPGKRFSITVIGEFRTNPNYVSGSDLGAFTFGVNNVPFTNANKTTFLNYPIHLSVTNQGTVTGGYYPSGAFSIDESHAHLNVPLNKKIAINLTVIGDVCTVSHMGRTWVYREAGISDRISETTTGFFIEPQRLTTQLTYFAVSAVWVNAPLLDANPFTFTRDQMLGEFMTTDTAIFQGRLRAGNDTYATNKGPNSTDTFAYPGTGMLGDAPYFRPYAQNSANVIGGTHASTAVLSSSAAAADQNLLSIPQIETNLGSGSRITYRFYGRLAANANTKRIKIKRSAGGTVWLDSGDITTDFVTYGGSYKVEWMICKISATYYYNATITYGSNQAGIAAVVKSAGGTMDANAQHQFLVTGTSAADVTLDYHHSELHKY